MIKKLYLTWCQYRLLVRRLGYAFFFLIGVFIVGPAVREPLLWEAIDLVKSSAWLEIFFDPISLVLDPLLVAAIPLAGVWGIAFAAYRRNPQRIHEINSALEFTGFLTGGVATVLFNFAALLLGVAIFAVSASSSITKGAALSVFALYYWLPAMFFRQFQLRFVHSKLLDRTAHYFALALLAIAAGLSFYVGLYKALHILAAWLLGNIGA